MRTVYDYTVIKLGASAMNGHDRTTAVAMPRTNSVRVQPIILVATD